MNTIDIVSTVILSLAAISASARVFIQLRKMIISSDIIVTHKKTGKSVIIGKHPQKNLGKQLLDIAEQ